MELDYHKILNWPFPEVRHTYTEKDAMLYALSLGFGMDPLHPSQLRFVYEKDLHAVPTMAVVLATPGLWIRHPATGIDWVRTLHAEQSLTLHRPLPAAASVVGRTRVTGISDKGAGKGALVTFETLVSDQLSDEILATVRQSYFCRGNGGYSAQGQPSDQIASVPAAIPPVPPDLICDLPTRADMALLYRLSGDSNALHADPAVAQAAGFARPILHGLATFGVAGHAILRTCCNYEAARLEVINARFSAPVFPGETLRAEIWRRGVEVFFRVRVLERNLVVLDNGYARCRRT
ncbi:MaoC/PaaZ C-terminal domain-containing protein [Massilia sp. LXY-6]|uniref:MaoC/PaaZ C-terminal domain-containing protein n=1 Tax=Massilia sp. LXY-6 TaxID=3379823 RepID=UPI003EE382E2